VRKDDCCREARTKKQKMAVVIYFLKTNDIYIIVALKHTIYFGFYIYSKIGCYIFKQENWLLFLKNKLYGCYIYNILIAVGARRKSKN
jgi:hypothetical protein